MTCWNNYRCYCPDTPFSLAPPCPCVFSFAFLFQKYLLSTSFLLFLEIQRAQESADDFEIAIWFKTQCPRSYFSELLRGKARGCLGPSLHPGLCFELLIHAEVYLVLKWGMCLFCFSVFKFDLTFVWSLSGAKSVNLQCPMAQKTRFMYLSNNSMKYTKSSFMYPFYKYKESITGA